MSFDDRPDEYHGLQGRQTAAINNLGEAIVILGFSVLFAWLGMRESKPTK